MTAKKSSQNNVPSRTGETTPSKKDINHARTNSVGQQ